MCFAASFTHGERVQKWPYRRGNEERTSEASLEDVHEWIMNWILQRDYPKTQLLAPIWSCRFCHFWLRYTTSKGTILHVLWQMVQECLNLVWKRWKLVWEARKRSHESSLGQSWWELGENRPTNTGKRALHLDDFSLLTTLCEDCIACNVHNGMTSWEKDSPRIGLATCLRKEHSGSFNVLNYWICKPCRNSTGVKKSQDEMLEPIGTLLGREIDSMDWLWDASHTKVLVKAVVTRLHICLIDYIIRGNGSNYTCNSEISPTQNDEI